MTKLRLLIAVLGVLLMPAFAVAEGPTFDFIDVGITYDDPDDSATFDNGTGWAVNGSYDLGKVHFFGGYSDFDTTTTDGFAFPDVDVSSTRWNAGFGVHGGMGDNADVSVELGFNDFEAGLFDDAGLEETSDWAISGSAGIRWMLGQHLELNASFGLLNFDVGENQQYGSVGAVGYFKRYGVGLRIVQFEEDIQSTVFFRFLFKKQSAEPEAE